MTITRNEDGGVVATSVMTPTLYLKAGEAQGNVLHCDYILVAAER
jgi:hypothetical protein